MIENLIHKFLLLNFLFIHLAGITQAPVELHVFGGISNYQGDLQPKIISTASLGQSLALNLKAGLSEKFFLRAGLGFSKVSADDKNNPPDLRPRNLSFNSNIEDAHLAIEYRIFSQEELAITPYVFAGIGAFRFNPYAFYGDKNEKVYLQPLGTEGQGLPEYPERQVYKLTQVYVPFGAGLLWRATGKIMVGIEMKLNKTFTDYLDDASTTTVSEALLRRDRGPVAVAMAFRRGELNGAPYPVNPSIRGNPDNKDWFYQVGLTFGYLLSDGQNNANSYKSRAKKLGCPKW